MSFSCSKDSNPFRGLFLSFSAKYWLSEVKRQQFIMREYLKVLCNLDVSCLQLIYNSMILTVCWRGLSAQHP